MKAFLVVTGTVFALVVVVHAFRIASEPGMAKSPAFWLITAIAAALSVWAWRLLRSLPGSRP